ncbi:MAG: hypothetical protein Kow0069_22980 [Promethearchaeota archaeon]
MSPGIPVVFPSEEWAKKYVELLNESEAYEEAAAHWEGSMLFVIKAGEITPVDFGILFDLWHGKCRGYKFWLPGQEIEADYVFEGPEANWLLLLEGKLDPIQGLMVGKFKLTGDMAQVMRSTQAAKVLVETLQQFEFEFPRAEPRDPNAPEIRFYDSKGEEVVRIDTKANTFAWTR